MEEAHFHRAAQAESARTVRHAQALVVLVVSLDPVSDTTVREAGEHALVRVIHGLLRGSDVLGHPDDGVFVVVLPNTTLEGGEALATRIVGGVSASPIALGERLLPISVSVGGCLLYKDDSYPALEMRTQLALKLARDKGGAGVVMDTASSPCLW